MSNTTLPSYRQHILLPGGHQGRVVMAEKVKEVRYNQIKLIIEAFNHWGEQVYLLHVINEGQIRHSLYKQYSLVGLPVFFNVENSVRNGKPISKITNLFFVFNKVEENCFPLSYKNYPQPGCTRG